jgi:acetoin:2,6-dichlorophenolindophenol oxidoreductase subunit alpha
MYENPLVPNKKLQQMFVAMAEMRALDEHIAGLQRKVKARKRLDSTRGEEACRVSMAIELGPGDLVSDSQAGVAMGLLAGAKVGSLLEHVTAIHSHSKKPGAVAGNGLAGRQLPWIEDAGDRLRMALGAALSFRTLKRGNIVVTYVRHGEVANRTWREVLGLAAKFELPVIFVVLPAATGSGKKRRDAEGLSAKARSYGLPGIPVDAADAVALYRVAQESTGRTRGGGGPVLVECVANPAEGRRSTAVDPLAQMRGFLLSRKVCSEAWMDRAADGLHRQLKTTPKKSGQGL